MLNIYPDAFLAVLPPFGAVFDGPVDLRQVVADVPAHLFGFKPLVPEDLLVPCSKLSIEQRLLDQVV